jgi:hypothetical protein
MGVLQKIRAALSDQRIGMFFRWIHINAKLVGRSEAQK